MSEIKDRQDAASAIDPIVAAHGDGATSDNQAVAAVEGFDEAAEPADAEARPPETQEPPAAEAEALQPDGRADGASDAVAASDIADAIEAELLSEAPQSEDASAFEHMPAAYADTIVELDPVVADDDAPLLDGDLAEGRACADKDGGGIDGAGQIGLLAGASSGTELERPRSGGAIYGEGGGEVKVGASKLATP